MRTLSRRNALVSALLAAFLIPITANAQDDKNDKRDGQEKVTASGTLKGFQQGVLHVVSADGAQYYVKVPDQMQNVKYSGTADADFLKPGMFVKFVGEFDKKGQSASPVKEISVFTPGKDDKSGVTQDSGIGIGQAELFNDKPAQPKPAKEAVAYLVVGRLAGARNGAITVAAGTTAVRVNLAKDASVSLNVADLSWMREGDKVSFDGWAYPDKKQNVIANSLEIAATESLGKKPKK